MKSAHRVIAFFVLAILLAGTALRAAPYRVEKLNRGVIAMRSGSSVFVSWRLLGLDPAGIGFNVYRGSTKVNASVLTTSTNLVDTGANLAVANAYTVRAVVNGVEQPATDSGYTLPANAPSQQYLRIGLSAPGTGYTAGDGSVGDVDGDGQYEIFLKWDPSNGRDNSQDGVTSPVYIDCYRLSGQRLWRINLGRNIRAGAHYTQFQVADYDGDGRAEMVVKTGDGTISGTGQVIGNGSANHVNSGGHILTGPEYLTAFNGLTGAVISTVPYQPVRGSVSDYGDSNGNRSERYLAGTAWLQDSKPSIIMGRGYYARSKVAAWDLTNGALVLRWVFDSGVSGQSSYGGRGAHWLSIADVDNNGSAQEIIYGGMTLNANGTGRYTTSFYAHGDALHVGDFIPGRAGQEIWMIHEATTFGATLRDGITGAIIFSKNAIAGEEGPARGVADDVHAGNAGAEYWASGLGFFNSTGGSAGRYPGSQNFLAYWDGDVTRELLDGNHVDKYGTSADTRLFTATGANSINGSKSTPVLSADIFGDWREEIILGEGGAAIRIYTTTTVTNTRIHTLMHDPQYRAQVAAQNSAYNQPPHLSFLPSNRIPATPRSDIVYDGIVVPPGSTYQAENAVLGGGTVSESVNGGYNGSGYANSSPSGGTITFNSVAGNGGGTKALAIRYANGATAARTGNLTVNGTTTAITFQPTGAWTTWQTLTVNVTLTNSSSNTIVFTTTGGDLANIDEITVP
jgi:rhamnogalacturonan endolyase